MGICAPDKLSLTVSGVIRRMSSLNKGYKLVYEFTGVLKDTTVPPHSLMIRPCLPSAH